MNPSTESIRKIVKQALAEDLGGPGDVTTLSTVSPDTVGKGKLIVKQTGVIAGMKVLEFVFHTVDPGLKIRPVFDDGSFVERGQVICIVEGRLFPILQAERVALNFIQHLSGIATLTNAFVKEIAGSGAHILDTRKTTPGLRELEKYAVAQGGGVNHRMGLYDMIMIKDNHIDAAGSLTEAVNKCLGYLKKEKKEIKIEVETRNLAEVKEALLLPVDRIMLDNMSITEMTEAVKIIDGKIETEASGNVTMENVAAIARTGVNYISVGALTHSAGILDITLQIARL